MGELTFMMDSLDGFMKKAGKLANSDWKKSEN